MPERVAQHKHCGFCGRAIPVTAETCSGTCEESLKESITKKRRALIMYMLAPVILLLFWLYLTYNGVR